MEDMSKVCDRFQQFCANSAKPLLYSGGFVTLISAVALGYVAHTSNVLYASVVKDAADLALNYYLQLAASVYLLLASILVYLAAYYDQKHIVRVVSECSSRVTSSAKTCTNHNSNPQTAGHLDDNQCRSGSHIHSNDSCESRFD